MRPLLAGVRLFQIREKDMSDRDLLAHARRVRKLTAANNALVIMNDRPDLAVLAELDGVHIGQDELSVSEARQILGGNGLIGVSTHSIEQAPAGCARRGRLHRHGPDVSFGNEVV